MKYKSISNGNWSNLSIWNIYDGTSWIVAPSLPDYSSDVYCEQAMTITVDVSAKCKSINLNNVQDQTRLVLNEELSVAGGFRLYTGTADSPLPFDNSSQPSIISIFLITGTMGKISFIGTDSDIYTDSSNPNNGYIITNNATNASRALAGWNMEIAFPSGKYAVVDTRFRCGNCTIKSGTLFCTQANGSPFRCDMDGNAQGISTTPSGSLTIKTGATMIVNQVQKGWNMSIDTFILEEGADLYFNYSNPQIAAKNLTLNGTIHLEESINQNFPSNFGYPNSSMVDAFNEIKIGGSGVKTLISNITKNSIFFTSTRATIGSNNINNTIL